MHILLTFLIGLFTLAFSDPFLRLRVGEARVDSECVKASLNPVWGEPPPGVVLNSDGRAKKFVQLDSPVFAGLVQHQRVEIVLWDKDVYTKKSVGSRST